MIFHLAHVAFPEIVSYQNLHLLKKKKIFFHLLKILLIHQGPAHTGTAQRLIRPLSTIRHLHAIALGSGVPQGAGHVTAFILARGSGAASERCRVWGGSGFN